MKPIILFRTGELGVEDEYSVACKYLPVTQSRTTVPRNSLVVPRYSALPYYAELEQDLLNLDSRLINSHRQHLFIANMIDWATPLQEFTPRTWTQREIPYLPETGAFILKGETNSRKFLFNSHMKAESRSDVSRVLMNLLNDSLISTQSIVVREYVPLKTYMISFHGLPITKEFRFFVLDNRIVGEGYYWASHVEDLPEVPDPKEVPDSFLQTLITRISDLPNAPRFYVMDIAQKETGDWILIELNDGSMSGLSCVDPDKLYGNIQNDLKLSAST